MRIDWRNGAAASMAWSVRHIAVEGQEADQSAVDVEAGEEASVERIGRETKIKWCRSQFKNNHFTEICCGNEAGSYERRIDSCIAQLKAQGPSGNCNESKEEGDEEEHVEGGEADQSAVDVQAGEEAAVERMGRQALVYH